MFSTIRIKSLSESKSIFRVKFRMILNLKNQFKPVGLPVRQPVADSRTLLILVAIHPFIIPIHYFDLILTVRQFYNNPASPGISRQIIQYPYFSIEDLSCMPSEFRKPCACEERATCVFHRIKCGFWYIGIADKAVISCSWPWLIIAPVRSN